MDDLKPFDAPGEFSSNAVPAKLQEQYEDLRKLFLSALFALVLLGFSLNIFLLRQVIFVRKELDAVRPQIHQVTENYNKNEEPQIRGFINTLVTYSQTHSDFLPILSKYKIVPNAPSSAAPAGTPATPPKKK